MSALPPKVEEALAKVPGRWSHGPPGECNCSRCTARDTLREHMESLTQLQEGYYMDAQQARAKVERLRGAIIRLWEDAEHDHARRMMLLTLRQDLGFTIRAADEGALPSIEELRAALDADRQEGS